IIWLPSPGFWEQQSCSISKSWCDPVGAGLPAKQAPRCMAPASPVFAGKPAPTGACGLARETL
ncbi:hypothetical protein DKX15_16310, partial [Enterococcus faecium]